MECEICPLGSYLPEGSLKGCTRKVTEKDAARLTHLREEVIPFGATKDEFKEAELEERKTFESELGQKIGHNGKICR